MAIAFKTSTFPPAIFYYESLLKITGGNVDVLNAIAICYYKLGKREEAKRYFEKSLKLNPEQKEIIEFLKKL
jgi:tetratricopeptide (TPR) repeat protein